MPISTAGLIKRAETLCDHCVVNQGCTIYATRPDVCRTWHCLWRRDAAMPDELRPDRSRMIFSLIVEDEAFALFETAHITCIAMKSRTDFDAPLVKQTIERYIGEGILPVWHSHGGGKTMTYPGADLADAITHPTTTAFTQLVPQGQIWRKRYESLIEPLQYANGRFDCQFVKL
ncbi:MAG: hypothetical protein VB032_03120 [Burkholderiaceae bacterium]|nr:hypothetical protein [Burkholderiaceae bacterium]